MKEKTYRLEGGFHNAAAIGFRAPEGLDDAREALDWLAINQPQRLARLRRHFCGISGCTCGGPFRATEEA